MPGNSTQCPAKTPGKNNSNCYSARSELYIGLMSGTSLDGVDAVLADFSQHPPHLIQHYYEPYSATLRERLHQLSSLSQIEMDALGETGIVLGHRYADVTLELLKAASVSPEHVAAIGCHGQTIRHRPGTSYPYTIQIGDPSTLAEHSGILTVAQFRQRDMAAGGQGAPLVPPFHQYLFAHPEENRGVLNLGGMANITLLPKASSTLLGFDTGPANVLIDGWCQRMLGKDYDCNGDLARQGRLLTGLLKSMQTHPFFSQSPPKSTGREAFHLDWAQHHLDQLEQAPAVLDVLRTLTELTAWSVASAITASGLSLDTLILCGGGAYNGFLMERIQAQLPDARVISSGDMGVQPDHMEALAFAWLARQTLYGLPGNHPDVTGAAGFRILGGIYPSGA